MCKGPTANGPPKRNAYYPATTTSAFFFGFLSLRVFTWEKWCSDLRKPKVVGDVSLLLQRWSRASAISAPCKRRGIERGLGLGHSVNSPLSSTIYTKDNDSNFEAREGNAMGVTKHWVAAPRVLALENHRWLKDYERINEL
mmetsp:Transcript_4347/g.7637  ORF Transcript_4347/g.7637 Transcript_4347/m.7637 type:complete len:141 (-) Transcript_4347:18-440(-)